MFKQGDKVVRKPMFRDVGWFLFCQQAGIECDTVCEVNHTEGANIFLVEDCDSPMTKFADSYFELVKAEPVKQPLLIAPYNEHSEPEMVHSPKHYSIWEGVEALQLMAMSMTDAEWRGYCVGNRMKYRLRAGLKGDVKEDLAKADKHIEVFHKYKNLCRQESVFRGNI